MQVAGRVVDDAQLRTTKSGQQVTGFTVAINRNYKAKDGTRVQQTTYFDCSYWNRPNITPHLTKGKLVNVTGFPSPRAYVTKEGEARGIIDFNVDQLDFLGGGSSDQPTSEKPNVAAKATVSDDPAGSAIPTLDAINGGEKADDLPF